MAHLPWQSDGALALVRAAAEGMAERNWEGHTLKIGEVVVRLDSLCGRCPMTTV